MPKNVSVKDTQEVLKDEETEAEVDEPTEEEEVEVDSLFEEEEDGEWDSLTADPDLEIWEGGPTVAQVNEWKEGHGDVYVTALTETKFVAWRTLTRMEFKALNMQMEQAVSSGNKSQAQANLDNEDAITELCVLFPKYNRNDPNEMAGVATSVANLVMEASAFAPLEVRQL